MLVASQCHTENLGVPLLRQEGLVTDLPCLRLTGNPALLIPNAFYECSRAPETAPLQMN